MRLIDADALLEALEEIKPHGDSEEVRIESLQFADCLNTVMHQSTAYDVEKVVEKLELLLHDGCDKNQPYIEKRVELVSELLERKELYGSRYLLNELFRLLSNAIDIVRKGGVE